MKGDASSLQYLNKVLYHQLTAINQYFLHAKMCKNWGLEGLHEHAYHASIAEMKHADRLADRILFLEGLPNFQALGKLRIGEKPVETLRCDLALAEAGRALLAEASAHAEASEDYVSRALLVDILDWEEEHIDWLETELDLVERVGEANYLMDKIED